MVKRNDVQIYELAFRKVLYGFWDNILYTPIQCGSACNKVNVCELKDNTGDNISDKNYFYSETTGTYWIWKNAPHTKYVGQCQYRRRLEFNEDYDFETIFKDHKIIVSRPIFLSMTLDNQLALCHPQIDIKSFENIVYRKFPEYAETFNNVFHRGKILFFSSSYITTWNLFNDYCSFMFHILDEYFTSFGFDNRDRLFGYVKNRMPKTIDFRIKPLEYHMLIGGFLQERLFTTWVLNNFDKDDIYYKDFKFMEEEAGLKVIANPARRKAERIIR